jgi:hypothetical protein
MNIKLFKTDRINIPKSVFIVVILLTICTGKIFAQDTLATAQDSLIISNVYSSYNSNNALKIDTLGAQKDTTLSLNIGFKVNFPGSISEIFIFMGLNKDNSDYQTYHYSVSKVNGENIIYQNTSPVSKFWKKDVLIKTIILMEDLYKIKWITIYCKDNFGKLSNRKYFKIQ